jgi:hypothetical protein
MNDDKDCDIEGDEECGHGEHLEVGEESVFYHVQIALVRLISSSLFI